MKQSSFLLPLALLFSLSFAVEKTSGQIVREVKEFQDAASECSLTLADAPAILGMRLGMSWEETKTAAPNLGLGTKRTKADGIGRSLSSKPNEEAQGVVNSFLEDRLFEIDVLFSSADKFNSTSEFVREFSKRFNLPEKAWTKADGSNNYLLTCQGFKIEARDQNHIVLTGTGVSVENQKRPEETAVLKGKN